MTLRESIICLALVPGVAAGLAICWAHSTWSLPWWAVCLAGCGGWLIGFALAAAGGALFHRWNQHR